MININYPCVMGIVNLSQDSFYQESRYTSEKMISDIISKMLIDGAAIIDIGACSTRPGSISIDSEQEWQLIERALITIKREFGHIPLSIDTFRSNIVKKAFDIYGEFFVNDISSGEDDELMISTVSQCELPYIAMHKKGTPQNMQSLCQYSNVTYEVKEYFEKLAKKIEETKIPQLIIDPGFGFAKDIDQNYSLLANLEQLDVQYKGHKSPILVGLSRKSMLYKLLDSTPQEALAPTVAVNMEALLNGAAIIRVHDVKEGMWAIKLAGRIEANRMNKN